MASSSIHPTLLQQHHTPSSLFPPASLTLPCLLLLAALSWSLLFPRRKLHQPDTATQSVPVDGELLDLQSLPLPPGRLGLPWVGETLEFLQKQKQNRAWEFFADRAREYGSETFKTNLFGHPTVVVTSPAGNKMAFANPHISWPPSVLNVIGTQSLIAQTGDRAVCLRQAFHAFLINPDSIRRYTHRASRTVSAFLDRRIPPSSSASLPHVLPLYSFMRNLTFSISCHLLLGIHDPSLQDSLSRQFFTLFQGILQLPINLPGTRYRNAIAASVSIRQTLRSLIEDKRSKLAARLARGAAAVKGAEDLLSGLLTFKDEAGNPMGEEEIEDNLVLLLFAGNDTSSIAATMACRFLGLNPAIMDEVYKGRSDGLSGEAGGGELRWEDLQKMKVTWRVVQETMRLQPSAQGSFKEVTEDFIFDGYRIPKSWKIYWSTSSTARNPRYFAEPERFDPSRFDGAGPAPFTYAPFGGGPRMCPGHEFARMELLIIIHHLITRYSWGLKYPEERITLDSFPRPVHGLPVLLRSRAATTE